MWARTSCARSILIRYSFLTYIYLTIFFPLGDLKIKTNLRNEKFREVLLHRFDLEIILTLKIFATTANSIKLVWIYVAPKKSW